MKIVVPKEILPGERRVALIPAAVEGWVKAGFQVAVEKGAGAAADYSDDEYRQAGAVVVSSVEELYDGADIVLKVRPPALHPQLQKEEIELHPEGALLIAFLEPLRRPEIAEKLAARKLAAFAMELVPRISRAQSMDALSSQASAAGYKAAVIAAEALPKYFPMLTTAAGTIPPAKVLVIGAGVAGLQAIATARRLGALVEAFDIRKAAKGEVESLGAKFLDFDLGESGEAEGGYAKEISEEAKKREHELLSNHVAAADVVITTASVPGKKAPLLITQDMIDRMRPGSVIVDMAVEQGGNVAGSQVGSTVTANGVTIIGPADLPSRMAVHTSRLYARNISALLGLLVKEGRVSIDFEDEIVQGACVTFEGRIVHPKIKEMLQKSE